jgi:hypothetical protein
MYNDIINTVVINNFNMSLNRAMTNGDDQVVVLIIMVMMSLFAMLQVLCVQTMLERIGIWCMLA